MAEVKIDRRQALDLAIAQIERQFGKGSVMKLGAGPLEAGLALIQMLLPLLSECSGEPGIDLIRRQVGSRGSGHKWTPLR